MSNIILLTCSPRANGNTDSIGAALFKELNDVLLPTEIIPLRSLSIRPCISCGFCITHPDQCVLEANDEVGWLFDKIRAANTLIMLHQFFSMAHLHSSKVLLIDLKSIGIAQIITYMNQVLIILF